MKEISYQMSETAYNTLLYGKKGTKDEPGFKGCETPEKLVAYVDQAFGLLGTVTEVRCT